MKFIKFIDVDEVIQDGKRFVCPECRQANVDEEAGYPPVYILLMVEMVDEGYFCADRLDDLYGPTLISPDWMKCTGCGFTGATDEFIFDE